MEVFPMSGACFPPLASVEAVRPVFLIVMGVFLMLIAWRLAKTSSVWTARMLIAGAALLGFGYAILLPLHEAGLIRSYSPHPNAPANNADALGWHVIKLLVMNAGWFLFGIGVALHAKILGSYPLRSPRAGAEAPLVTTPHESVA